MYRATGEQTYLDYVDSTGAQTGLDWSTVGDYGNIALLTMDNIDKSSSAYTKAVAAVKRQADGFATISQRNPYGVSLNTFNWGSNMTVANAGIILGLYYDITGDEAYNTAALANTAANATCDNITLTLNLVSTAPSVTLFAGLIGLGSGNITITNSTAEGIVKAPSGGWYGQGVGAFVGRFDDAAGTLTVKNCVNYADLSTMQPAVAVAGIVAFVTHKISSNINSLYKE